MCRAKPLVFYVFIDDKQLMQEMIKLTSSGDVLINDCIAHAAGWFMNWDICFFVFCVACCKSADCYIRKSCHYYMLLAINCASPFMFYVSSQKCHSVKK